ncbi:zinc ribbon domain-containing protein [Brevibacillus agri]|uniref:zinc ribbon domain-containing protein n=1 Tax=Brevibacillus agri TaxID=51101 RepID=UPI0024C000BC|nr:zinc ribbon domain-containing protein [Brevibacillus agri]MED4573024.1 zinc ribbon domain-containing protein [Brevibacillus agri]WHX29550.1 zinc ribbon domain-containing protein [Brevibacillus agri]
MKSIKPGRGPSAMGAAGSIAVVVFGIFWTIMAFVITQDSPFPVVGSIFPLFGVVFVIIGIAQGVYHYKNATGKERMSLYDITDASEEGDPLNRKYGGERAAGKPTRTEAAGEKAFCPYCGQRVQADYQYCPGCGKKV